MNITVIYEELTVELASLDIVIHTLQEIVQSNTERLNLIVKAAIMALIVQLYSGIENIFKRVCKYYQIPLLYGETSNQLLARYFTDEENRLFLQLSIFITKSQISPAATLRRFRHAAVYGYLHLFKEESLIAAGQEAPRIYNAIKQEVLLYAIKLGGE